MIVTSVQIKTAKTQKHLYCPVFTEKRRLSRESRRFLRKARICGVRGIAASRKNIVSSGQKGLAFLQDYARMVHEELDTGQNARSRMCFDGGMG